MTKEVPVTVPLFMRTRRIMKEKVLTTVVTFETTT